MRIDRILVVDDSKSLADALVQALQHQGLTAEAETIPLNVQKRIRSTFYDIIILDVVMPDYGGEDVMIDIATFSPTSKVLLTTARAARGLVAECMELGACGYIERSPALPSAAYAEKVKEMLAGQGAIINESARRELVIKRLQERLGMQPDPWRKGLVLEKLMKNIFESVPHFERVTTRVRTGINEELDVEFEIVGNDAFWTSFGPLIYAECKNWGAPRHAKPTATDFDAFYMKLSGVHRCKLGFFITVSDFTKGFTEKWRSKRENILVVPVNGKGLQKLVVEPKRGEVLRSFAKCAMRGMISR